MVFGWLPAPRSKPASVFKRQFGAEILIHNRSGITVMPKTVPIWIASDFSAHETDIRTYENLRWSAVHIKDLCSSHYGFWLNMTAPAAGIYIEIVFLMGAKKYKRMFTNKLYYKMGQCNNPLAFI